MSAPETTILLLDDDELWMRSLARRLERCVNAACVRFSTPDPALGYLTEMEPPKLCVIDFMLGGGWTGARFARNARARLGTATPQLVLVSGTLEEVSLEDLCPFDGAYSKSMDTQLLLNELLLFIEESAEPRSHLRLTELGRARRTRQKPGNVDR